MCVLQRQFILKRALATSICTQLCQAPFSQRAVIYDRHEPTFGRTEQLLVVYSPPCLLQVNSLLSGRFARRTSMYDSLAK